MTHRLMDLKNDYAFKKIFGTNQNKDFLLVFINDLLKKDFVDITVINSEISPETFKGKKAILDIHAITTEKVRINIEIQVADKFDMVNRSLFYWSKTFQEQLKKGDNYASLKQTIVINLLNYDLAENGLNDDFHTTFRLREDKWNYILSDVLEMHFIEFRKFNKIVEENDLYDVAKTDKLNIWMMMFNAIQNGKINPFIIDFLQSYTGGEPLMKDFMSEWERVSIDDKNWSEYLTREKLLHDENVGFGDIEKRGEKRGEKSSAMKIALKMLSNNESDEKIMEYTEITSTELSKLKATLKQF